MKEISSWTDAEDLMKRGKYVLEIYGRNCAPCVTMTKNLQEVSFKRLDIHFGKIEVSKVPEEFLIKNSIKTVPFCIYGAEQTKYYSQGLRTVSQIEELFK